MHFQLTLYPGLFSSFRVYTLGIQKKKKKLLKYCNIKWAQKCTLYRKGRWLSAQVPGLQVHAPLQSLNVSAGNGGHRKLSIPELKKASLNSFWIFHTHHAQECSVRTEKAMIPSHVKVNARAAQQGQQLSSFRAPSRNTASMGTEFYSIVQSFLFAFHRALRNNRDTK